MIVQISQVFTLVKIYLLFFIIGKDPTTKSVTQSAFTCSKLTIETLERRHWCLSGVFIINFKHVSPLTLVFLLLTLSR